MNERANGGIVMISCPLSPCLFLCPVFALSSTQQMFFKESMNALTSAMLNLEITCMQLSAGV